MFAFTLPAWLEWLLGVDAADVGESTDWTFKTSWAWPPWATVLLAAVTIGLVAFLYYRERRSSPRWYVAGMAGLRLAAIGLMLLMVAESRLERVRTNLPYVVVLVDVSASMDHQDLYRDSEQRDAMLDRLKRMQLDQASRLNLAKVLFLERDGEMLREIAENYRLKFYFVGRGPQSQGEDSAIWLSRLKQLSPAREIKSGDRVQYRAPSAWGDATFRVKALSAPAGPATLAPDSEGGAEGGTDQMDVPLEQLEKVIDEQRDATRLGQALRDVLADLRGSLPAAILMVSDGVNTEGESLADAAALAASIGNGQGVPLFAVGLGSDEPARNLKLGDLAVDDVVFVDDIVPIETQLTGEGYADKSVEVVLKDKQTGETFDSTTIIVPQGGLPETVRLQFRPRRSEWEARRRGNERSVDYELIVEAETLPGETTTLDNVAGPKTVKVVDETIRVLLVQSGPSFEYRFLKGRLEREDNIELRSVLQEQDLDFPKIDAAALPVFPVRREELLEYDVIVFGDVDPAHLNETAMENVASFVRDEGRAVLFIAGPKFTPLKFRHTPLAPLFPFDLGTAVAPPAGRSIPQGFVVQPTLLGIRAPHMQLGDDLLQTTEYWNNLPPVYWLLEIQNLAPSARVLAEHPSLRSRGGSPLPVFIEQYYGQGKVLFHATDDTWRWRYQDREATLFRRYYVQTLRYLARAKLLGEDGAELVADKQRYQRGDAVRLRARFKNERDAPAADDGVIVMIERPGFKGREVPLLRESAETNRGIFKGKFENVPEGRYRAWIIQPAMRGAGHETEFVVEAPPGETDPSPLNADELKASAAAHELGRYYTFETAAELVDDLPAGSAQVIEPMPPVTLWNKFPAPLLLLILLTAEWIMRKRKGLL